MPNVIMNNKCILMSFIWQSVMPGYCSNRPLGRPVNTVVRAFANQGLGLG